MGSYINTDNINNYIIAEIDIKDNYINKDIRIINSFEQYKREYEWKDEKDDYKYENENEIKKCIIEINKKKIPFCYFYKFNQKGKYIIKYSFVNYLTKINYLFKECKSLINIDLSNLNMENVVNMSYMFSGCNSLTNINFSNCQL